MGHGVGRDRFDGADQRQKLPCFRSADSFVAEEQQCQKGFADRESASESKDGLYLMSLDEGLSRDDIASLVIHCGRGVANVKTPQKASRAC